MDRDVIDSLPGVYICWKDKDSVFCGCNQNFADFFDTTPEEIVGVQDVIEDHIRADKEVIQAGKVFHNLHESIQTPTGKSMRILTQKGPWKNSQGETIGIVVCFIKDPSTL